MHPDGLLSTPRGTLNDNRRSLDGLQHDSAVTAVSIKVGELLRSQRHHQWGGCHHVSQLYALKVANTVLCSERSPR
jgi:hypothetical protein